MIVGLEQMLPHKSPMVLVDKLISNNSSSVVVEAIIKNDYPFTSGPIGTWVGIELMAQSAAILSKLTKQTNTDKASLGFLLGSRSFTAHVSQFMPGQKVRIEIQLDPADEDQVIVNAYGVIKTISGDLICEGSITLYEPKDDAIFLSK